MKKTILLLMIAFIGVSTFAQINNMKPNKQDEISFGLSFTNVEAFKSNSTGLSIGYDYDWFHVDFATNFATGEGDELEFESSETYKEDKRSWYILNFGMNIQPIENVILTPKIGYVSIKDIYTDPIGTDTYFMEHYKTKFNLGVIVKYTTNNITLRVGTGIVEVIYVGIGINLNN
jgi:hypothetical protein